MPGLARCKPVLFLFSWRYVAPMAAMNYNRPKPIDLVWYRQGCYINIQCGCGRRVSELLGPFAQARRVPTNLRIYELIARLRCSCGRRPIADLTRYKNGN